MLDQQIKSNKHKTIIAIIIFCIILSLIGAGLGYVCSLFNSKISIILWILIGAIIGFTLAMIRLPFVMHNQINKIMKHNDAKEIKQIDNLDLYNLINDVSEACQIPMPRIFLISDDSLNAFTIGKDPNNSAIAITQGLIDTLTSEELTGVIAHEMSHIRNYDILFATTVVSLIWPISMWTDASGNVFSLQSDDQDPLSDNISDDVDMIENYDYYFGSNYDSDDFDSHSYLSDADVNNDANGFDLDNNSDNLDDNYLDDGSDEFDYRHDNGGALIALCIKVCSDILMLFLGPWLTFLSQMAFSKKREYLADQYAVRVTGDPDTYIFALKKIDRNFRMFQINTYCSGLYFANPFYTTGWLHSCYPSIESRIEQLSDLN